MRYRTPDVRTQDPEEFLRQTQNNPYLKEVYEYPEWIWVHPDPKAFPAWQAEHAPERLHLEIGCGSGRYLIRWAEAHPQDLFLGMELRYKRLALAARKLKRGGLANVLLLRERGEFLDDYLTPESLDVLHVNFPDPWPKKGHAKNRLMSPEFLTRLHPYLKPGGEIRFKTDHQEYFAWVSETFRDLEGYTLEAHTEVLQHSPFAEGNVETEFELLFRSKGDPPIGFLIARREPVVSSSWGAASQ